MRPRNALTRASAAPSPGLQRPLPPSLPDPDPPRSPALPRSGSEPRWRRDALRRRLLATADLLAAAVASLLIVTPIAEGVWTLAFLPLWILAAKLLGLYDRDHRALRHLTGDELTALVAWAAAGTSALALLLPFTPAGPLNRGMAVLIWLIALGLAVLLRSTARLAWWRFTAPELTAVVGEGQPAASVRRKLELFRDMHFELTGEIDPATLGTGEERTRCLEALADRVDRIIVATPSVDPDLIGELAAICRRRQVKLSVVSPLRGRALPAPRISQVGDLPVHEYNTWDVSRSTAMLKRAFDLTVSAFGLILLAPLLPLVAIAIRLDSPGPVIFSQVRAGLRGRPFQMYKFRTMTADAEERLPGLVRLNDLREPAFKLRSDPRVTRVGRLLRRFSLDELPQLVNVLRGEMSIVGPRPEQVELVERYQPEHRFRLDVKPGMTGPMQVHGRGDLTFSERLAVELDYIENLSIARDTRILLHTIPAVLRGNGAY